MNTNPSDRTLDLFERALACPKDDLGRFLDEACAGDARLRSQVESLVSVARNLDDFVPHTKTVSNDESGGDGQPGDDRGVADSGALQPGCILMERYEIRETLGSGGMGNVYRATDSRLGREVAIKVVLGAYASHPEMRERFDREMRSAAAFSHPNVMEIHDVGSHEGLQVAVMEFIDGRVLRELVDEGLSIETAVRIATGIAAGLEAAHQRGLLHRDIKPENIMVSSDGHVKILDFGLARPEEPTADQNLTRTAMTPGTIPYMSPEQAAGETLERATDVFSLGTVLYEMLVGTNPFRGATPLLTLRRVVSASPPPLPEGKGIPSELEDLVIRMLRSDPGARPSANEVARELRTVRDGLTARKAASAVFPAPDLAPPRTQYARCGEIHLAYQVFGDGPIDLLLAPGFISNIDNYWASPQCAFWLRELSRFARVAMFDKRGTGLSDRVSDLPNMEERIEDVCAVMDAAGFESAALLGISEGGSLASVFAATYPQRCRALILHGSFARFTSWFETEEALEGLFDYIRSAWGSGESLPAFAPTLADDAAFREWWGKFERLGANPTAAIDLMRMNSQIDITRVLPSIQAPTLVINRTRDVLIDPDASRVLAESIPGAVRYTSDSVDHIPFVGQPVEGELRAIREFLQGIPDLDARERGLATVLAVRVDSQSGSATIARVEEQVDLHRGRELTEAGGAHIATFDGPVRAIRCARAIAASVPGARLCVHTGEVFLGGTQIEGPALDVATRVAAAAGEGDVVVTRIVKDLVAGSAIRFESLADEAAEITAETGLVYRVV